MFDALGMLRAAAAGVLSGAGTTNTAALTIDGTARNGVDVRLHVPSVTGTSPTLDVIIQDSPDASVWSNRLTFAQVIAAGEYRQKLVTKQKYVRMNIVQGGTTPAFGVVECGFETGSEYRG